ncbi:choice-of-anchor D domain-containing protein [Luteolibacter sp. SL250]|uniref:choice-of-anchor D domain-containing protein n=1 Tax=Luteolibacter sp. SL250 TaxID=2995170 RepID=UPI00227192AB|nr:choice-of-anchor D domain-containing protein [Luteolibacter sp. SL250]WAC21031.1 choice-of-anchor D domain-containing protein [Luteolibacter sp. SL250]
MSATIAAISAASAATGDLDPSYLHPAGPNGTINPMAATTGGRTLMVSGNVFRVDHRGARDPAFRKDIYASFPRIATLKDGAILVNAGVGHALAPKRLLRLNTDGGEPFAFPTESGFTVHSFVERPDGRLLVSGQVIQGGATVHMLRRYMGDGALDPTFSATSNGACRSIFIQSDGKILVGGEFTTVGGQPRKNLARLLPDGALDSSFTANCDGGRVEWILQDQGGGILVGGAFTSVNGSGTSGLVRLLADGSPDPAYPSSPGNFRRAYDAQLQADGKLVVHGGNELGARLYRVDASGFVDPTLSWGTVTHMEAGVSLQDDGSVLLTGSVEDGGKFVPFTHRFLNDPGSSSLDAGPGGSLEWTRTGSLPAVHQVTFETRPSGGSWGAPVPAVWTGGKWRFNGVLPENGAVRARGGTLHSKGSSIVEEVLNLGTAGPDVSLALANNTTLPEGLPFRFPNSLPGASREVAFKIRNLGDGGMTGIFATITGQDAASFTVSYAPPRELGPQEDGTLYVTFGGGAAGLKSAVLTVFSDDPDTPSYQIPISAENTTGLSPVFITPEDVAHKQSAAFDGSAYTFGSLTLGFAPQPGTQLLVVDGGSALAAPFADLPDGAPVSAEYGGVTYQFRLGYRHGDSSQDIVLTLVGEGTLQETLTTEGTSGILPFLARDTDGSLVISNYVAGTYRLERWRPDGVKDPSFSGAVASGREVVIQRDGRILAGNARFHRDGAPDLTFQPAMWVVRPLAVQADGRILAVTSSSQSSSNRFLKRLLPDGSEDATFVSDYDSDAKQAHVLPDGSILICASDLEKLSPTGALITSFPSSAASSFAVQPDGRIFLVRNPGSSTSFQEPLVRLNADGTADGSFSLLSRGGVSACVLQSDGRILIGGNFTLLNGVPRMRAARLFPDGSLDPSFRCELDSNPSGMSLGEGGSMFISGSFSRVNGIGAGRLVKVSMGTAESSVEAVGQQLRWLRSGVSPELHSVSAQMKQHGVTGWTAVGNAERITGGWVVAGIPFQENTLYRMVGATTEGASSGLHHALLPRGEVAPSLRIRSATTELVSGGTIDFGSSLTGLSEVRNLALRNDGLAVLSSITTSITGADAADFTVSVPPASSIEPGSEMGAAVRFTPATTGSKTATLRVMSNDPAVPVHEYTLTGVGRTDFSPHFGEVSHVPLTVDSFDAAGLSVGTFTLGFAPQPGAVLMGIRVTGTASISGSLLGLPDHSAVTATFNGVTYLFHANYRGGDGNDLVFVLDGPHVADHAFAPVLNERPNSIALQDDGRIIISGAFTSVGGNSVGGLMRLMPDGTPDPTFTVTGTGAESMAVQPDGKVLVACDVTAPGGVQRLRLARLNRDGSLDLSFQADIEGVVNRICLLRSGKVLVGGAFTKVDGVDRRSVAIVNQDGTLDPSFTADLAGAGSAIYSLAEQADGKLLLGGSYTSVNGFSVAHISRVGADGQADQTFNPRMFTQGGGTSSIAVQPDGKIVIGGFIAQIRGVSKRYLARLNADGSLDTSFNAEGDNPSTCLRIQADGKIMVSGLFSTMNGVARPGIARLHPDGTLDETFNPRVMRAGSSAPTVHTMLMTANGSLLVGGNFDHVDHRGGANFARLGRQGIVSEIELTGGDTIRWNTGGALTEMHSTTFELSTDMGVSWASLGAGSRVAGGWSLGGLSLPPSGQIRARGVQILTNRAASSDTTKVIAFPPSAISPLQSWRDEHFDDAFDGSVDLLDSDHDGVKNLVEFALGLPPHADSSGMLPPWTRSGGHHVMGFTRPAGAAGITYSAEWSETMREDDWHPAEDLSVGDAKSFRVPVGTEERKFFRLKVANP